MKILLSKKQTKVVASWSWIGIFTNANFLKCLKTKTFTALQKKNCSKQTFKKLYKILELAPNMTKHEVDYWTNFECKSSSFYGLPKIHKSTLIKEKCDVICEKGPYCGTNIIGPDQTPRIMRGVWSGPTIFVANDHLKETFFSLPAQFW